jgi:hypothetical protein
MAQDYSVAPTVGHVISPEIAAALTLPVGTEAAVRSLELEILGGTSGALTRLK